MQRQQRVILRRFHGWGQLGDTIQIFATRGLAVRARSSPLFSTKPGVLSISTENLFFCNVYCWHVRKQGLLRLLAALTLPGRDLCFSMARRGNRSRCPGCNGCRTSAIPVALDSYELLVDACFAVLVLCGGFLLGWWLRRWLLQSVGPADVDLARETASRLGNLARSMRSQIDKHRIEMAAALQKMAEAPVANQEAVSRELRQLIESNEKLQAALDKAESKMHEQARTIADYAARVRTDTLTQVLNRGEFDEELVRRVAEWHRRERPFTVIMLDVDQFKRVNDRFGHQTGDQVLQFVAQVLRNTLREMDLLARFGGDEFAILLPDTNLDEATQAADRLRQRIEEIQVPVDGHSLNLTVSLGLAEVLPSDDDETVLSRADEALYAAKESGRNRCCYHDGSQTATLPLGGIDAGLPQAAPPTATLDHAVSIENQKGDRTGILPVQSPETSQRGQLQTN